MTVYYVDYEGESGSGDGSSFANRADKIADISPSAGDEIRVKKSKDPTLVGTATVRREPSLMRYSQNSVSVTKSTTTGQSYITKSNHGLATGSFISLENFTNTDLLNGIWQVTVGTGNDVSKLYLDDYTAPSTGSSSGYIQFVGAAVVKLATAVTQNIASTGPRSSAFTASTNVTTALTYTFNQWSQNANHVVGHGDEINISSSFGTGLAAYFATGTLDLSGYQQVSFYVQNVSGTLSDNSLSLRLCTDTAGSTSVHTIPITLSKLSTNNRWCPLTVDLGTNLNSSIQSIAVYVDNDDGAHQIRLHNIIACKASSANDSLTLNSVIGLNTTADPAWWGIYQIDGKNIFIGNQRDGYTGNSYYIQPCARWSATNTSASLYKRQPIIYHTSATSSSTQLDSFSTSGSDGNEITISGGWDTTNMSSQTGYTFVDYVSTWGYGIYINYKNYWSLSKFGFVRGNSQIYVSANYSSLEDLHFSHYGNRAAYLSGTNWKKIKNMVCCGGRNNFYMTNTSADNQTASNFSIVAFGNYNANGAVNLNSCSNMTWDVMNLENTFLGLDMYGCSAITVNNYTGGNIADGGRGSSRSINIRVQCKNCTFNTLNLSGGYHPFKLDACTNITFNTLNHTDLVVSNNDNHYYGGGHPNYDGTCNTGSSLTINGGTYESDRGGITSNNSNIKSTGLVFDGSNEWNVNTNGSVNSHDHDGVSGSIKNIYTYATFNPDTTTRYTSSGVSWKYDQTNASTYSSSSPFEVELGKVICNANAQVTITIKAYRSSTSMYGGIKVPAYIPLGISSVVSAVTSGSATTWETVTINFTPTAAGAIPVMGIAYSDNATGQVYFDDVTIAQA